MFQDFITLHLISDKNDKDNSFQEFKSLYIKDNSQLDRPKVIENVYNLLEMTREQVGQFQDLIYLITKNPVSKPNDFQNQKYEQCLFTVSDIVEVTKSQLEFIIDLLTEDPSRIFKIEKKGERIEVSQFKKSMKSEKMKTRNKLYAILNSERMSLLSHAFKISKSKISQFVA